MNASKTEREQERQPQEPYCFTKRHGSTTFRVNVYSSATSGETANDIIVRLIRSGIAMGKAVNE